MTEVLEKERVNVTPGGSGPPFIQVPVTQLKRLEAFLRSKGIPFWTDRHAISTQGGPFVGWIRLEWEQDTEALQTLLDRDW